MENTEIRGPKNTTLNLRQVETFVFFAAMLLAITLEGACVYWLWLPATARTLFGDTGQPCRPMDGSHFAPVLAAGSSGRTHLSNRPNAGTTNDLGH